MDMIEAKRLPANPAKGCADDKDPQLGLSHVDSNGGGSSSSLVATARKARPIFERTRFFA